MEEKSSEEHRFFNKKTIIILFIFLILVILVFIIYKLFFAPSPTEITYDPNKNYSYDIKENTLYLLSEDGVEQSYKCDGKCSFYLDNDLEYKKEGKVLLKDEDNVYLYDLIKDKKISSNYKDIKYILDEEEKIKLFKVTNHSDKDGIIDLNGTVLVNLNYEKLGKVHNDEFINYSYENNQIAAKNSKAWGVVALDSGAGLIDFQYEDIKLSPYERIAVKELDKWYLVDNVNKRLLFDSFDSIFIYEKYTIVILNKELYILDQDEKVISNKIPTFYEIDPWGLSLINGVYTYIEEDILYILIDTPSEEDEEEIDLIKYYYNEDNKEIIIYEEG
ncbi:MAG TPA: hypothetical protein GX713_04210 [Mollicutes bacterium]|nr:hypothetical protein [Mollicutes bacterium]